MARTTLTETNYEDSDGNKKTQYRTTVPKGLAEAMGLKGGDELTWEVDSANRLSVRINTND